VRTPTAYRSGITSPDVLAAPGTVTCTKQAGGSCGANTYYLKVVAVNAYGRTTAKAGNATVTTETSNLTARAAFAAVVGATHYDIYCSVDADPKWVGRITEAQRASGIKITAVGVPGAGGTAGAVDVEVPGTGLQAATTAAVNVAYAIPTEVIDCSPEITTGYEEIHQYCDLDLSLTITGDAQSPALVVVPFFYNALSSTYHADTPVPLTFGGAAATYGALRQRLRVEVRGNDAVALLVESIAGTGASLDIAYTLN